MRGAPAWIAPFQDLFLGLAKNKNAIARAPLRNVLAVPRRLHYACAHTPLRVHEQPWLKTFCVLARGRIQGLLGALAASPEPRATKPPDPHPGVLFSQVDFVLLSWLLFAGTTIDTSSTCGQVKRNGLVPGSYDTVSYLSTRAHCRSALPPPLLRALPRLPETSEHTIPLRAALPLVAFKNEKKTKTRSGGSSIATRWGKPCYPFINLSLVCPLPSASHQCTTEQQPSCERLSWEELIPLVAEGAKKSMAVFMSFGVRHHGLSRPLLSPPSSWFLRVMEQPTICLQTAGFRREAPSSCQASRGRSWWWAGSAPPT